MTERSEKAAPVRLCCGQRHYGALCPDGKVMCCLCFGRFDMTDLNVTEHGPEDVCRECATREARRNGYARRTTYDEQTVSLDENAGALILPEALQADEERES